MTKENIYYMDDNAFDRFYKRARYQANSFVAGKLGSKAADYLTTLPDFAYLVCKLMLDPDVPSSRKLDLGLALLYVLSPLDFVPDSFPLLGKIDDAYAILVSVAKLLRSTDRNIILRHWLGDPETIDDSGKAIADDEKAAKKQKADKIAAQLKAVTDPQQRAELFDELMAEYNEDTGENSYPHGYCFTSGSMVTEFEDACKALDTYEVSGVVESKHGYHVILRMPTQGDDLVMSSDGSQQTLQMLVAQDQLSSLLTGWVDEADISWEPKFRSIDYAAVFTPKQSFWKRLDVFDWFEK